MKESHHKHHDGALDTCSITRCKICFLAGRSLMYTWYVLISSQTVWFTSPRYNFLRGILSSTNNLQQHLFFQPSIHTINIRTMLDVKELHQLTPIPGAMGWMQETHDWDWHPPCPYRRHLVYFYTTLGLAMPVWGCCYHTSRRYLPSICRFFTYSSVFELSKDPCFWTIVWRTLCTSFAMPLASPQTYM